MNDSNAALGVDDPAAVTPANPQDEKDRKRASETDVSRPPGLPLSLEQDPAIKQDEGAEEGATRR